MRGVAAPITHTFALLANRGEWVPPSPRPANSAGWPRAAGDCRSEVKGENRAQPGSEDMSGGKHPATSARDVQAQRTWETAAC